MKIKHIFLLIIFMFSTLTMGYSSANKETDELIKITKSYYSTEDNSEIQKILDEPIKDGIPADKIKNIIVKGAQSNRNFNEIKEYILKLDNLARQDILPEHAINIILEGFAKNADKTEIFKAINNNEKEWAFCRDISREFFKRKELKKLYYKRLSIEKSIITLIDLDYDKKNILTLSKTVKKENKNAEYFSTVLSVALKIKMLGLKNSEVTEILKTAIEYNLDKDKLLNIINIISNEIENGKVTNKIAETIIYTIKNKYKYNRNIKTKRKEGTIKQNKTKVNKQKPSGGHLNTGNTGGTNHREK